ncbi:MAG: M14 family zinc carboxypeptidase [Flavobacterium sp.]
MKLIIYIFIFIPCMSCSAQFNPEPKQITAEFFPDFSDLENCTPALNKNKGFTNHNELISFLKTLSKNHPDKVNTEIIGKSQKGHDIPLVVLNNKSSNQTKVKVFYQGGLHGDEPASTEGILYLLYQILNNEKYQYLLDRITLAVVPMANIDGYLNQQRLAANGLDLNRDQTKLMAPESVVLKQAFSSFDAEVALDFHEYNAYRRDFSKLSTFGITSIFDVMFLYSSNLNVSENIRFVTDTLFVENTRKVMQQNNLRYFDYMSTSKVQNELQFNKGSINPRSSATSFALTNCISALIEVRGVNLGRTSFKRRINTTFLAGISFLETAYNNIDLIKETIRKANNLKSEIVITSEKQKYLDTIPVIDLDSKKKMDLQILVSDAKHSTPTLKRSIPSAYIIRSQHSELIDKMKVFGISIDTLNEEKKMEVEIFKIIGYERDPIPTEKMNMQYVTTDLIKTNKNFDKNDFIIYTNQKNSSLLFELLEPEAISSFVSFGIIKTKLNDELPIYRLP